MMVGGGAKQSCTLLMDCEVNTKFLISPMLRPVIVPVIPVMKSCTSNNINTT